MLKFLFAVLVAFCTPALAQVSGPGPGPIPGGGSGTVTSVVAGTGLSGGTIISSGTISLSAIAADIDVGSPPAAYGLTPVVCGADQTSNLTAMMAYVQANLGGARLKFHACTYLFAGTITIPNDGASPVPHQVPIEFVGAGANMPGEIAWPTTGTIFNMTATNAAGRFQTLGLGSIVIHGVQFVSNSPSTGSPMFLTTNTTVHLYDNAFFGSYDRVPASITSTAPNEDMIILGGTTTTLGGGTSAAFQGYKAEVDHNYCNYNRRCVYLRVYANANNISNNYQEYNGGSVGTGIAPFEVDASAVSGQYAVGNTFIHNSVEIGNYMYGIKLTNAAQTQLISNDFYDQTTATSGGIYIGTNANQTYIYGSLGPGTYPYVVDPNGALASGSGIYISGVTAQPSVFGSLQAGIPGYPNVFGPTTFNAAGGATIIQPAGSIGGNDFLRMTTGPSDSSPNVKMFSFTGIGQININPTGSTQGSSAAIQNGYIGGASLTNNLRSWTASGAGGAFLQNSGTGGAYFTMQNYAALFTRWDTGAQVAQIGPQFGGNGYAGLGLGTANDAGIFRRAAGLTSFEGASGAIGWGQASGLRSGASGNTDLTGRVTLSGGTATYSLTGPTYASAPNCITQDVTTPALSSYATETTTTITFTGTGTDVIKYICAGTN